MAVVVLTLSCLIIFIRDLIIFIRDCTFLCFYTLRLSLSPSGDERCLAAAALALRTVYISLKSSVYSPKRTPSASTNDASQHSSPRPTILSSSLVHEKNPTETDAFVSNISHNHVSHILVV